MLRQQNIYTIFKQKIKQKKLFVDVYLGGIQT